MLPPCVVFVCLPIPSTVASQTRPKLLVFRRVCAVASPSSSVCPAQPSVHGSGAQSQISRLRPGKARRAQPSSQGRPQEVSGTACRLHGVCGAWGQAAGWQEMLLSRGEWRRVGVLEPKKAA